MGPAGTKRLSVDFSKALMIPFLTGERVRPLKVFNYYDLKPSMVALNSGNFLKSSATKKLKLNRTIC